MLCTHSLPAVLCLYLSFAERGLVLLHAFSTDELPARSSFGARRLWKGPSRPTLTVERGVRTLVSVHIPWTHVCFQVYLGINLSNGSLFAVKDVAASQTKDTAEAVAREIRFLSSFHHDHIVSYLGTELHDSTISIFTEFMPGGSLADLITSFGVLPDQLTARYIRQVTVQPSRPPRCRLRQRPAAQAQCNVTTV